MIKHTYTTHDKHFHKEVERATKMITRCLMMESKWEINPNELMRGCTKSHVMGDANFKNILSKCA